MDSFFGAKTHQSREKIQMVLLTLLERTAKMLAVAQMNEINLTGSVICIPKKGEYQIPGPF